MERTTQQNADKPTGQVESDTPERGEQARAKAYLDLWEQHVVQTALHGPVTSWRRTKS